LQGATRSTSQGELELNVCVDRNFSTSGARNASGIADLCRKTLEPPVVAVGVVNGNQILRHEFSYKSLQAGSTAVQAAQLLEAIS
jgi:hypothetical protein